MSSLFVRFVLLAALLPIASLVAQAAPEAGVRVTDPVLLQAWGYASDAQHVYRLVDTGPEADRNPDELLGGSSTTEWTSSAGFEFHPIADTTQYVKGPAFLTFNGALVSLSIAGFFETQIRMPNGATWQWLDIAGFHDHATQELLVLGIERCLPFANGGNPTETVLFTRSFLDQDGAFFSGPPVNRAILSSTCTYHVRVRFGNSDAPNAPGVLIQLSKVRAQWSR